VIAQTVSRWIFEESSKVSSRWNECDLSFALSDEIVRFFWWRFKQLPLWGDAIAQLTFESMASRIFFMQNANNLNAPDEKRLVVCLKRTQVWHGCDQLIPETLLHAAKKDGELQFWRAMKWCSTNMARTCNYLTRNSDKSCLFTLRHKSGDLIRIMTRCEHRCSRKSEHEGLRGDACSSEIITVGARRIAVATIKPLLEPWITVGSFSSSRGYSGGSITPDGLRSCGRGVW